MHTEERQRHINASDYTTIVYVADDGKEFMFKRDCENHDRKLFFEKIGAFDLDLYPFLGTFYYMDSPETVEYFVVHILNGHYKTVKGNKIAPCDWVCYNYEPNSNGPDDYDIVTLNEVVNALRSYSVNE